MKTYQNYFCLFFTLSFMLVIKPDFSMAQKDTAVDNGYYITYPDKLMVRLFLSQKYAPFTISGVEKELIYKTSSKLNFGAGFTYRSFTLNPSYGLPFLVKTTKRAKQRDWIFSFTSIHISGRLMRWVHLEKAITLIQRKIIVLASAC